MITLQKAAPSRKGQAELEALKRAVARALERKKRLGQYAVVWKDGNPFVLGEDTPNLTGQPRKSP